LACRVLLGVVFLAALVGKVRSRRAFAAFADSLRSLRLLPGRSIRPVVGAVVLAEAGVPALLIFEATARVGFLVALGLLVAFGVAIGVVLSRRAAGTCRCFGDRARNLGRRHLVRAGVLAGAAAAGLASTSGSDSGPGGQAVAVAAGLVLAVLAIVLDDLVELLHE
jgi:hypothetical protein